MVDVSFIYQLSISHSWALWEHAELTQTMWGTDLQDLSFGHPDQKSETSWKEEVVHKGRVGEEVWWGGCWHLGYSQKGPWSEGQRVARAPRCARCGGRHDNILPAVFFQCMIRSETYQESICLVVWWYHICTVSHVHLTYHVNMDPQLRINDCKTMHVLLPELIWL